MASLALALENGWNIGLREEDGMISSLDWSGQLEGQPTMLLLEAASQIKAYFAGELKQFDLPLKPQGSGFQQKIMAMISLIPHGQTCTYGDIARELDTSPQAVGHACAANAIPIIIPCHRVLSSSGLGGYSGAGGSRTKLALLRHENPDFAL